MKITNDYQKYIILLDNKFKDAKTKRLSRMDVEWGKWSAEMNREIRRTLSIPFVGLIFRYWLNRSYLLQECFLYGKLFRFIFRFKTNRALKREGKSLLKELRKASESGKRR